MATDSLWGPKSIPASADLSAYQFRFMRLNGSGQLALAPIQGGPVITVLQDKPNAAGQPGLCSRPGDISKIVVASSVTKGDYVMTNTLGQAVTATSGNQILGQMLDTIAVAGGIGRMVFQPMGRL